MCSFFSQIFQFHRVFLMKFFTSNFLLVFFHLSIKLWLAEINAWIKLKRYLKLKGIKLLNIQRVIKILKQFLFSSYRNRCIYSTVYEFYAFMWKFIFIDWAFFAIFYLINVCAYITEVEKKSYYLLKVFINSDSN